MPDFAKVGKGYRFHVTGLTHDERGYPTMTADCQHELVTRLVGKVRNNVEDISLYQEDGLDDADVVVVTYGISSRVAMRAIREARKEGAKIGHLRLLVVWPFPERYIRELAGRVKALVVPELNLGQVVLEVERCAAGQCSVVPVSHAGGTVHSPQVVHKAIMEAVR